jgi:putative ubiquitin-RnfH superfamily antitoxin RatB of RatAB toxin-antitoxin module
MALSKLIRVEVAYARPDSQRIVTLEVEAGSTIEKVIQHSGILKLFPEIDLARQKVGIFSKPRDLSDLVNDGDRIEIYRPLIIDPKEARRARARKKR